MLSRLLLIALLCAGVVGCDEQTYYCTEADYYEIRDSVFSYRRQIRESTSRIARLAADSAKCAEDRLLGWPSYSRCMNYCGKQWSETILGDTIWGCVDSVHHATKRYYRERVPARCAELLRKDPAKGLSGCCNAHHADCPSRNRGEIGEACANHFVDANKKVDTGRWWYTEYHVGCPAHEPVRDSIWHCEPNGGGE